MLLSVPGCELFARSCHNRESEQKRLFSVELAMPLAGVIPAPLRSELRDGGITTAHEKLAARIARNDRSLRELVLYVIFLVLFTVLAARGLGHPRALALHHAVRGALVRPTFEVGGTRQQPAHRAVFGGVATPDGVHAFLGGPLVDALFPAVAPAPVLGYSRLLGGVRIGQFRSKAFDCSANVDRDLATSLSDGGGFACFGESDALHPLYGGFSERTESKAAFGGASGDLYAWSGGCLPSFTDCSTGTTAALRSAALSSFRSGATTQLYPAPAFGVIVSAAHNASTARRQLHALRDGGYIDSATRAIAVDAALYNAQLDLAASVRLLFEMPAGGGVVPSARVEVLRLRQLVTAGDYIFAALAAVVLVFHCLFLRAEAARA
eukprot:g6587.t1